MCRRPFEAARSPFVKGLFVFLVPHAPFRCAVRGSAARHRGTCYPRAWPRGNRGCVFSHALGTSRDLKHSPRRVLSLSPFSAFWILTPRNRKGRGLALKSGVVSCKGKCCVLLASGQGLRSVSSRGSAADGHGACAGTCLIVRGLGWNSCLPSHSGAVSPGRPASGAGSYSRFRVSPRRVCGCRRRLLGFLAG